MPAVVPPAEEDENARQGAERKETPIIPEEERVMGETLNICLARESPGLTSESPAWGMLRDEYGNGARDLLEEEWQEEERAEGRAARTKPEVHVPSLEEWRQHRLTHLPYRSCCPHCVAGKAVDDAHRLRATPYPSQAPEFHFYYCLLRSRPGGEQAQTVVGKERTSQSSVAHVVPSKGAGAEWVARQLAKDIRKCGRHGQL